MKQLKIVVIGVGSTSFGRATLADIFSSEELRRTDLTVSLVDIDPVALDRMSRFAGMLKNHYGSTAAIETTTDRCEVLPGANYVVLSVARKRYELWDRDFYLPLAHGFKQVLGECGGPGGAFHTLRSLHLVVPIAQDLERLCPDALLLNFTNPESRVCVGVRALTKVRIVGLCHGAFTTLRNVARILDREQGEIDITIAGLNHFHWVTDIRDRTDGSDRYPEFHQRMAESDCGLEPLTRLMFETFDRLPFTSDSHVAEYVGFGFDACGPIWAKEAATVPADEVTQASQRRETAAAQIQRVVDGSKPLTDDLASPSQELAVSIICDIEFDKGQRELAVNIANADCAISNLPEDAVVEVCATVDAAGLCPVPVGPLPEPIAAMCRTQISIQKLLVEAYATRSKKALVQALAIDPVVDSIPRARQLADDLLRVQADFLPELGR